MSWTIERAEMAERVLAGTYYLAGAYSAAARVGRKRTIAAMRQAGEIEEVRSASGRFRLTQAGMNALQLWKQKHGRESATGVAAGSAAENKTSGGCHVV